MADRRLYLRFTKTRTQGIIDLYEQNAPVTCATLWKALRKRETPYAMAVSAADTGRAEWRIFMGTYKGATDIVTKHVWPVPDRKSTRLNSSHRT